MITILQQLTRERDALNNAISILEGIHRANGRGGRRSITTKAAAKPKRRISAAGRKRISEAAKARWARAKKARGVTL